MHSVSSASSNSDAVVVKQFYSPFYQTEACVSLVKTSSMDTYICERFLHVYVKWHSRVRKNIDRLDAFSFISSICIFICLFVFVLFFVVVICQNLSGIFFFNLTESLIQTIHDNVLWYNKDWAAGSLPIEALSSDETRNDKDKNYVLNIGTEETKKKKPKRYGETESLHHSAFFLKI